MAAAAVDAKKRKKLVKKKAPERNYAHWTKDTFDRLVGGSPELLGSSFTVNHQMVMSLLDRPGDGCAAVRRLVTDNHEPRKRQRQHIRRAIAIYRSLVEADLLEFCDPPDELGRRVRVTFDLQDEFALHQPLSLWAIEAIGQLDAALVPERDDDTPATADAAGNDPAPSFDRALAVLTVIESIQENPAPVLAAQVRMAKDQLMSEMKAAGVEYEERMERLAQVEPPRPHKEWLFSSFNEFRRRHPWVGGDTVKPKSVARDLLERSMTFGEYIRHYGLKNSEGAVLRYLSDVYKGLIQNVPMDDVDDELDDVIHWLGTLVRSVDSSLLDEWERLTNPDDVEQAAARPDEPDVPASIVDDPRAAADAGAQRGVPVGRGAGVRASPGRRRRGSGGRRCARRLLGRARRDRHRRRCTARRPVPLRSGHRTVEQVLADPAGHGDWHLVGVVDLAASRADDRLVISLVAIEPVVLASPYPM